MIFYNIFESDARQIGTPNALQLDVAENAQSSFPKSELIGETNFLSSVNSMLNIVSLFPRNYPMSYCFYS
jgi:hypothetical protein